MHASVICISSHKTHLSYRNYEVDGKYGIAASLNEDGGGTASAWSVDGGWWTDWIGDHVWFYI
eukprot:scaffold10780_cov78-Cyclotella_meneghiniana.AAC.24